jgi:sulfate transport system substrate-binding protein
MTWTTKRSLLAGLVLLLATRIGAQQQNSVLVASWDGSSRLFGDLATRFEASTGTRVYRSHGGSSRQARAVLDGLPADVLCVSEAADLDLLVSQKRLSPDWRKLLPQAAVPFGSAVVFIVRPGNPKGLRDWADLAKPGVQLISANPSSSGSGRVNHLAALAWCRHQKMSADASFDFFKHLYGNALTLESGSRGATLAFFERGLGDVLVAWQSEAALALKRWPERGLVVWPSVTLAAEPRIGVLTPKGQAWADFLFTPAALSIAADQGFIDLKTWKAPAGTLFMRASQLGDENAVHEAQFSHDGVLAHALEAR